MAQLGTWLTTTILAAAVGACAAGSGDREVRPLIAEWDGDTQRIVGSIDIAQNAPGGRVWLSHPNQEDICQGSYRFVDRNGRGTWSLTCTNGDTASGVLQAYGEGRGSSGSGTDSHGRRIRYTLGPDVGQRQPGRLPAPSIFNGVAPSRGEPIPVADIEALFRYCVASNPAGLPATTTAREYCQCLALEIRGSFSYQAFMTLIGEVVATRRATGEKRLAMHPQVGPLARTCVASGRSPLPVSAR